jgi:hypothetical protein
MEAESARTIFSGPTMLDMTLWHLIEHLEATVGKGRLQELFCIRRHLFVCAQYMYNCTSSRVFVQYTVHVQETATLVSPRRLLVWITITGILPKFSYYQVIENCYLDPSCLDRVTHTPTRHKDNMRTTCTTHVRPYSTCVI